MLKMMLTCTCGAQVLATGCWLFTQRSHLKCWAIIPRMLWVGRSGQGVSIWLPSSCIWRSGNENQLSTVLHITPLMATGFINNYNHFLKVVYTFNLHFDFQIFWNRPLNLDGHTSCRPFGRVTPGIDICAVYMSFSIFRPTGWTAIDAALRTSITADRGCVTSPKSPLPTLAAVFVCRLKWVNRHKMR